MIFCCACQYGFCQTKKGIVRGRVIDGTSYRTLYNAIIAEEKLDTIFAVSLPDGYYTLSLSEGNKIISFSLPGFQKKIVTGIKIKQSQPVYLDVILYPAAVGVAYKYKYQYKDSARIVDSVVHRTFEEEILSSTHNFSEYANGANTAIVKPGAITPGLYKNTAAVIKQLSNVIQQDNPGNPFSSSFIINGMGERYTQVLLNGAVLNYFDPLTRSYPLSLIPSEITCEVSVQKNGYSNLPADAGGGTIEIKTKDYADKNFYYLQLGSGYTEGSNGKDFYGDKIKTLDFLGLSGKSRNMPEDFPTTRSRASFNSLNIQQQVDMSKNLANNLAPVNNGNTRPDAKILLGFGKNYTLKKAAGISLLGFINHLKTQHYNESAAQVMPDVAGNPYPFSTANKTVIASQYNAGNYYYNSQSTALINTSVVFGKNKISFRNFGGSIFSNTFSQRANVYKTNEDTQAHSSVNYTTSQKYFINSQLAGEHVLSPGGKFKMDWQATYTYINQQNPDERNFLLREDLPGNRFEIASPVTANAFTNSGRLWRQYKDNNFSAAFNLSFPFNLVKQPQVLSGGIYMQQNYRVANADLLLVQGKGYYTLSELLAPERYYPGGLNVYSFYVNQRVGTENFLAANQNVKASYSASANTGAAYLKLDGRVLSNLLLQLGARVESASTLASDIFYVYLPGFRNPQFLPNYENTRVNSTFILPAANVTFKPGKNVHLVAGYFKTLNRPQLQELVAHAYYDAASFMVKTGNPLLGTAQIDHVNAGVNFIINSFSNIVASAFYKKIDQPIEYMLSNYSAGTLLSTPHNMPPAELNGLEASLRLNLGFLKTKWLTPVSIFANGNYTQSKVQAGPIRSFSTPEVDWHQLSGSPDYTINTGIVIQQPGIPEITFMYSRTGDYIMALGSGKKYSLTNGKLISAIPDYWVKGREQMDIQVAQKLFKNKLQVIAGVNNLLKDNYIVYQDLNGNKKFDEALVLQNINGQGGIYKSGTDNTVSNFKMPRSYYVTLSWVFK